MMVLVKLIKNLSKIHLSLKSDFQSISNIKKENEEKSLQTAIIGLNTLEKARIKGILVSFIQIKR
jgi:hypothetical protein